jgi:hypothetical protein
VILSHRLQLAAQEFAVFEPVALAYIERCRKDLVIGQLTMKNKWGPTLEGMLPKFKRGEMVVIETREFFALYYAIWCRLDGCSAEDKAVLDVVLERMHESETVESQYIRAGQKPYPYGERKRRLGPGTA